MSDMASVYAEHRERVVRVCLRYLRNLADAEDAAQETFARAAVHIPGLSGDAGAYLAVVARRVCFDETRRQARQATGMPLLEAGAAPGDVEADALGRSVLASLLRHLRPRERMCLIDTYAGYSYEEIAERHGQSVTSVATVIWRARKRIRQAVEGGLAGLAGAGLLRRLLHSAGGRGGQGAVHLDRQATAVAAMLSTVVAGGVTSLLLAHSSPPRGVTALRPAASASTPAAPVAPVGSRALQAPSAVRVLASPPPAGRANRPTPRPTPAAGTALRPDEVSFTSIQPSPGYQHDGTVYAGGDTWMTCMIVCPTHVLFVSSDRGATWRQLPARDYPGGSVLLPPDYPADPTIYAVSETMIAASTDGGASFHTVARHLPSAGAAAITAAPEGRGVRIAIGSAPSQVYDSVTGAILAGPPLPPNLTALTSVVFAGDASHLLVVAQSPDPLSDELVDNKVFACATTCTSVLTLPVDSHMYIVLSPSFASDHTYFAYTSHQVFAGHDDAPATSVLSLADYPTHSITAIVPAAGDTTGQRLLLDLVHFDSSVDPVTSFWRAGGQGGSDLGAIPGTLGGTLTLLPDGRVLTAVQWRSDVTMGLLCSTDDFHTWRPGC